ncbi:MAG: hypothetical protein ACKO4Q_00605 [Planctomycetota bacterium]
MGDSSVALIESRLTFHDGELEHRRPGQQRTRGGVEFSESEAGGRIAAQWERAGVDTLAATRD